MPASVGSEDAEVPRRASAGGRFEIRRWLGAGGNGVVYEAFDRQRSAVVALKLLSRIDATSLLRFKTEFRTLADLSHPNLLAIHELLESGGDWLLVMELVDGCDLRTFIRPEAIVTAAETE
ncbi:MAG TPA: protein kinase, partial [Kofleriaceae bacterium]